MHAVQVNAGGEDVGVAAEGERGEEAAVRAAPDSDALRVYLWQRLQIQAASLHVLVLGGAKRTGTGRVMEVVSVADAKTIVHRKHDVTIAREVLVHSIRVCVIVHVVPTEQHLPR